MPRVTSPIELRALRWCRRIHPQGIGRSHRVAELYDHLMSAIDERIAHGMSAEEAFEEAKAALGERSDLAAEHAKLHGLAKWSVLLAALATLNTRVVAERAGVRERAVLLLGISLFFAASILLSSAWLAGSDVAQTVQFLLIAIWFIPYSLLSTLQSPKGAPCRIK